MQRDRDQVLSEWLVLTAQSGQRAALEQLLKLWYPKFIRYSTHQLRDPHAAKDAVQDALMTIARKIGSLDDPAAFPKWAYRILHRRGVDLQRREIRWREREANHSSPDELEHAVVEPDPADSIREDLSRALRELGELSYNVIHLHYLHGLSVKEIAAISRVPEGTIKSRLHTARKKLKELLGEKR